MKFLRRRSVARQSLVHFTRQLRVFVKGGIPLGEAIAVIADETTDQVLKSALVSILGDLNRGEDLSDCFDRHHHVFPAHFVGLVRSAEATGDFVDTLDNIAAFQSRIAQSRSRITSALTYPTIVMFLALGTVVILAGFVIPRFQPLFEELGSTLPLPTRILLNTTSAVGDHILLLVAGSVGFAVLLAVWMPRPSARRVINSATLRLPVVGRIVQYVVLERFCRIFATSVRSGLPITAGLRLSIDTISNTVIREKMSQAVRDITMGMQFSTALARTDLFPSAVRQMIRVGEETGTLAEQITAAAEFLDSELEQRMQRMTALFEPLLIVVVGVVVGFVAVALVSAMYGVLDGVRDMP